MLLSECLKHLVAGIFAAMARLCADPAMLVHGGVLFTLRCAGPACDHAGSELSFYYLHGGLSLPRQDSARRVAYVRAVLIQTDTADKFLNVLLSQTCIRAIRAGLGALETGSNALGHHIHILDLPTTRMGS
jgi:hypothetical protein